MNPTPCSTAVTVAATAHQLGPTHRVGPCGCGTDHPADDTCVHCGHPADQHGTTTTTPYVICITTPSTYNSKGRTTLHRAACRTAQRATHRIPWTLPHGATPCGNCKPNLPTVADYAHRLAHQADEHATVGGCTSRCTAAVALLTDEVSGRRTLTGPLRQQLTTRLDHLGGTAGLDALLARLLD